MKTAVKKTAAPRKRSASRTRGWTEEQKQQIAGMAYQHFLARGGEHGYHMEDWLRAEAEVAAAAAPKPRRARAAKA